jgi:4-aminobutyrate aminotransferase
MLDEEAVAALMAERALAEVVGFETDEVARNAAGTSIVTYAGRTFIDFTSGIAVNSVGHNNPEVTQAIIEQAQRVTHVSDTMRHTPQLELASWMRKLFQEAAPGEPWSFLLKNSGSESIDAAAKLALKVTGRKKFIAFDGAFHGRTIFGTTLSHSKTGQWAAYEPFIEPLRANVFHAPAPRCGNCQHSSSPLPSEERPSSGEGPGVRECCAAGVEKLIDQYGDDIAAVFMEPMQGEGGYRPFSREAAARIRKATADRGVLLIVDEVQSGWGRTGKWFAFQHLGIRPDIVVFGKAVGGGLPLAGVAAPHATMQKWEPGEHGTTFGGNPISCAAGLSALKLIEREGLVERAAEAGETIKKRLAPLVGHHGVGDVRGHGLMIGVELRKPDGSPDYARCEAVKRIARDEGLLVLTCGAKIGKPGTDNSTIRLIPPLNTPNEIITRALDILVDAISTAK